MEAVVFILFVVAVVVGSLAKKAQETEEANRRRKAREAWREMEGEDGAAAPPDPKSELQQYLETLQGRQEPAAPAPVPVAFPVPETGESTTMSVFDCEHEEDEPEPVRDTMAEVESARQVARERADEARRYRAGKSKRKSSVRPQEPIAAVRASVNAASLAGGLSPADARRGIIMMEVLGAPRALRPYGETGIGI